MFRYSLLLGGIALISLSACKTVQHIASTEVAYIETVEQPGEDPAILDLIAPYKAGVSAEMDVVLGDLTEDLIKSRPNSNLGNWFTDVLLTEANQMFFKEVDMAFQNYGGLRLTSLAAGPLTKGEIFELMPFDNTLVVLEMQGDTLMTLLEAIDGKGGWPMSQSISYKSTSSGPVDIMIQGETLDLAKRYRVALPDYVANGGDQADFLKPIYQEDSGVYIRDIIISHLIDLKEKGLPIIIDNTKRVH